MIGPRRHASGGSMLGLALFVIGLGVWTLTAVLGPFFVAIWAMDRVPGIDDSARVVVAMAVGVALGWLLSRATYRPLVKWLDPTPRCRCGYDIRGLETPICPECGEDLLARR